MLKKFARFTVIGSRNCLVTVVVHVFFMDYRLTCVVFFGVILLVCRFIWKSLKIVTMLRDLSVSLLHCKLFCFRGIIANASTILIILLLLWLFILHLS